MGIWAWIGTGWLVGSCPLALLMGKAIAWGQRPVPIAVDPAAEVDAFLERLFVA